MNTLNVTNAVIYNRRGKVFEARLNGARIAEADTRLEAEALLIEAIAPDLASRIEYVRRRCGEVSAKRAHRGAKLLLAGAVKRQGHTWQVASETREGVFYRVGYDGHWYCGCEDFANGLASQRYGAPYIEGWGHACKHVFAVRLADGHDDLVDGTLEQAA